MTFGMRGQPSPRAVTRSLNRFRAFCPSTTTTEPLLFLYPRFSSAPSCQTFVEAVATPITASWGTLQSSPRAIRTDRRDSKVVSNDANVTLSRGQVLRPLEQTQRGEYENVAKNARSHLRSLLGPSTNTERMTSNRASGGPLSDSEVFPVGDVHGKGERPVSDNSRESQDKEVEPPPTQTGAVGVPRLTAQQQKAEDRASIGKRNRSLVTKYIMKENFYPVDWKVILKTLRDTTDRRLECSEMKTVEMQIPKSAVCRLLIAPGRNIWDLAERFECDLSLSPHLSEPQEKRTMLIRGSEASVNAVQEIIEENSGTAEEEYDVKVPSQGYYTIGFKDQFEWESQRSLDRFRSRKPRIRQLVSDVVPLPPRWTSLSMLEYVQDVCQKPLLLSATPSESRVSMVAVAKDAYVRIIEAFDNPTRHHLITAPAVTHALNFFVRHSQISLAHQLLKRLRRGGIASDIESHNILLRSAAKAQNLIAFRFAFKKLLEAKHHPNHNTWLAFLLNDLPAPMKRGTVQTMKSLNLLRQPPALQAAVARIIRDEIREWLDSNSRAALDILPAFDRMFTPVWIAPTTINPMLDEFSARGLITESISLIQHAVARGMQPDEISITTILEHCLRQSCPELAIAVVQLAEEHSIPLSESTHGTLFRLAWKCEKYNLARVVWTFACIRQAVTRPMRQRLEERLNDPHVPSPSNTNVNTRHDFRRNLHRIILGIHPTDSTENNNDSQSATPDLREMIKQQREQICNDEAHDAKTMIRLKKDVLSQDLKASETWQIGKAPNGKEISMAAELQRALELDREWLSSGFRHRSSTAEKAENLLSVGLAARVIKRKRVQHVRERILRA